MQKTWGLIQPTHKDKSKIICSNYCPIFILPIIRKICEKLLRLYKIIQIYKKIGCYIMVSLAFKKKPSEHAPDLRTNVIQSIEKQEKSSWVFLDCTMTFDNADHKLLLTKLDYYGIIVKALKWFKYLTTSYCFLSYEWETSS